MNLAPFLESSQGLRVDLRSQDLDELDLIAAPPPKTRGKGKNASTQGQPFNIGKFSAVSKSNLSDLALSDDEDVEQARQAHAVKGKRKLTPSPSEDEAFAMDSEEEEIQLDKAIRASKGSAQSRWKEKVKGKAGGGKTVKPQPAKKGNGRALRVAVARAADSTCSAISASTRLMALTERARAERGAATPSSLDSPKEPTPSSNDGESEFEGSQLTESELSSLSAESEASESSGSDRSIPIRHAARKRKFQGKGKGRRLDGGLVDEDGVDLSKMSEEERTTTIETMRAKKREERKAWEEARAPLKNKQEALQKELGRKLTNGERNFIALSFVSVIRRRWTGDTP